MREPLGAGLAGPIFLYPVDELLEVGGQKADLPLWEVWVGKHAEQAFFLACERLRIPVAKRPWRRREEDQEVGLTAHISGL